MGNANRQLKDSFTDVNFQVNYLVITGLCLLLGKGIATRCGLSEKGIAGRCKLSGKGITK